MSKLIPLTKGKFAIIDDADFNWLNQWKWKALNMPGRNTKYAARNIWNGKTKKHSVVLMHRQILKPKPEEEIDHIDGNPLNNKKENLRKCTHQQNVCNKKKTTSKTTSKYKGVCWVKSKKKWRALIAPNGKNVFLGYYDNEKKAARTYDKAASKYFGQFARLNF